MRKISLKKVVFAVTTISTTALIPALIGCSIHYEHEEDDPVEPILKTINMTLPEDIPDRIAIGNVQTTKAIDVKCLDDKGKPIKAITTFNFKDDKGNVPTWITIGPSDRKFHIDANVEVGTYNFVISAQAKQNDVQIESEPQSFSLEVYDDQPVVGPDQIEITCSDPEPLVFTTSSADIDLGIIASRSDYPQHLVSKECDWDITKLVGNKDVDLDGNELFTLDVRSESAQIKMSTNVDGSYVGTYQLTIKAISVLEPFASNEIVITLNVVDGLNQIVENEGHTYYYSRQSINLTWTLDHVDSSVYSLTHPQDYIYEIPVTKIADNFAARSGVNLSGVKLTDTFTTIGDNAFSNQTSIHVLELPGVKYIGESAFENCTSAYFNKKIPQPRLEAVEKRGFYNCSLLEIDSVNSFSQIGEEAFAKSGIKAINLGGCVFSIGNNCFDQCSNLTDITIKAANPPQLDQILYTSGTPLERIHVPPNSIEIYEDNENWSIYTGKFVPIE